LEEPLKLLPISSDVVVVLLAVSPPKKTALMESRLPWRREAFYQQKAHISRALWQRYTKTLTGIASANPDTRYVRDAIFLPHPVDRSNDASLADIECITRHRNCTHARMIGFQNFMHCNKCRFQNKTNRSQSFFCTETNHERFCKSHSHHGRKLHSLPTQKKQKQNKTKPEENKTFPKDNLREDSETLAINSIPGPQKKRKKRDSSRAYYFSLLPHV
jgi:hypothetical protein